MSKSVLYAIGGGCVLILGICGFCMACSLIGTAAGIFPDTAATREAERIAQNETATIIALTPSATPTASDTPTITPTATQTPRPSATPRASITPRPTVTIEASILSTEEAEIEAMEIVGFNRSGPVIDAGSFITYSYVHQDTGYIVSVGLGGAKSIHDYETQFPVDLDTVTIAGVEVRRGYNFVLEFTEPYSSLAFDFVVGGVLYDGEISALESDRDGLADVLADWVRGVVGASGPESDATEETSQRDFDVSAASGTRYIGGAGNVNVRSGPGTDFAPVGRLATGAAITVTGMSGGWYRISFNGDEGWVSGELTSASAPIAAPLPAVQPAAVGSGGGGGSSQGPAAGTEGACPRNCTEAVAMGVSAQRAAECGLDRDGDGVACYGD